MTKPLLPALPMIALLMLAGCGNDSESTPAASTSPSKTSAAPAVVAAPADVGGAVQLEASAPIDTHEAISLNADCNLEGVDDKLYGGPQPVVVSREGQHVFSGWAVDVNGKSIPADLTLVLTGVGETQGYWTNKFVNRVDRAGVAETKGYGPELNESGFSFTVDTTNLAAGVYHAFVVSVGKAGTMICDPGRQVTLTQ